jgi:hypothetical protein
LTSLSFTICITSATVLAIQKAPGGSVVNRVL